LEALMDGTLVHIESEVIEPAVTREERRTTQHQQMRLAG
jgi:hypothetical protein